MVIYEIINTLNGKRYIGKDKYNDPNYLGSGKLIRKAIQKYGTDHFIKLILEHCTSEEHMCERERYWIQITNAQTSAMYYNIGEGGLGGDNITNNPNRDEFIKKMRIINNDPKFKRTTVGHSDTTRKNQSIAAQGRYTLQWFIQKYGIDEGTWLYEKRNQQLSIRNLTKQQIESIQSITESILTDMILQRCTQQFIKSHFNVSHKQLYKKFKQYYQCNNFSEVVKKFNLNTK